MQSTTTAVWAVFKQYKRAAKDRQGRAYTHTFMSGGSFIVPNDEAVENAVFAAMERDLNAGHAYYINEIATDIFKMFLDLDFYHTDRLNDDEIAGFNLAIYECFCRFFPSDATVHAPRLFQAIVLHANPGPLCNTRDAFEQLVEMHREFDGTQSVQVDASVVKTGGSTGIGRTVEWITTPAPNGTYRCTITGDNVELLTSGAPAFKNPHVYSDTFMMAQRTGAIPSNASVVVRVSDELKQKGPWKHDTSVIFALDDHTYFENIARDQRGLVKHGIHVIFPSCFVKIEQALYMREALVDKLITTYGDMYAPAGWPSVVDNAVYGTGRGLRMYGANKASSCVQCRGKKHGENDMKCGVVKCGTAGQGKIDEGRPYTLHSVYLDGKPDAAMRDNYMNKRQFLIRNTSIRTIRREPSPNWSCYSGCPQFGDELQTIVKEGEVTYKIKQKEAKFRGDLKIKTGSSNTTDIGDKAILAIFEKHIRTRFVTRYAKLRVVSVCKSDKGFYFITVGGEGQHWCLNKNPAGDHRRNTIYFQCDHKGIYVRCRCPKLTTEGRMKGMCKDYKSSIKALNISENAILFPELMLSVSGTAYPSLPAVTTARSMHPQAKKARC